MDDFFSYLTAGEDDRNWGLYLNVAGRSKFDSHKSYPSTDHPSGYYFSWTNGRVLNEYQLNYITQGRGLFEDKSGRYKIKEGSLMILPKGRWHRYRPDLRTGWTENYIGFSGTLADHFFREASLLNQTPIIHFGDREEFIDTYYKIFDQVLNENPGFQQIASGLVIKLLGYMIAFRKQLLFSGKPIEEVIQNARFYIRQHIPSDIDMKALAASNNVGYSYFRRMFKEYTGISPHQYHLDLKIMRAKELLISSNKSIKEICFELGFDSSHYFSRFFKQKVGVSPSDLRS